MSRNIEGFKITASRTPYRRAGLDLSEPLLIGAHALSQAQLETLRADPVVHVAEEQFTDDAAPQPVTLPTKKADLQDWLKQAGLEFAADETVAQLTDKASAYLDAQAGQ